MNRGTGIPKFKLAKVATGRRSGSWLSGRPAAFGPGGGLGGLGVAPASGGNFLGLGMAGAKVLATLTVVGSVSVGSWQHGKSMMSHSAPADSAAVVESAPKIFADKNAPRYRGFNSIGSRSRSSSLGYVFGSLDGLTPRERAKRRAEAEAARRAAEAEARRKANEAAAKQAALSGAAKASPRRGLLARRFGQLSAGFGGGGHRAFGGGGFSGGAASLAGGVGRGFGAGPSSLSGGPSGSDGGAQLMGSGGSLTGFRGPSRPGLLSAPRAGGGQIDSRAKRQLDNTFRHTLRADAAPRDEIAATTAAAPFDNSTGSDEVVTDPGEEGGAQTAGTTVAVAQTAGVAAAGGQAAGANIGAGPDTGPIVGYEGAACPKGQAPDAKGLCQTIKTSSGHKDDAPWKSLIAAAEALLALISLLAIAKMCLTSSDPITVGWKIALSWMIICAGAAVTALGVTIMAMGQLLQGGILTAIGAFITLGAVADNKKLQTPNEVPRAAAQENIQQAQGALDGSSQGVNVVEPDCSLNFGGSPSTPAAPAAAPGDHSTIQIPPTEGYSVNPDTDRYLWDRQDNIDQFNRVNNKQLNDKASIEIVR